MAVFKPSFLRHEAGGDEWEGRNFWFPNRVSTGVKPDGDLQNSFARLICNMLKARVEQRLHPSPNAVKNFDRARTSEKPRHPASGHLLPLARGRRDFDKTAENIKLNP